MIFARSIDLYTSNSVGFTESTCQPKPTLLTERDCGNFHQIRKDRKLNRWGIMRSIRCADGHGNVMGIMGLTLIQNKGTPHERLIKEKFSSGSAETGTTTVTKTFQRI